MRHEMVLRTTRTRRVPLAVRQAVELQQYRGLEGSARVKAAAYVAHVGMTLTAQLSAEEVGLDAHEDVAGILGVVGHHGVQPGHPFHGVGHPALGQDRAILVEHADVVVGFRPVDPHEDHSLPPFRSTDEPEGDARHANGSVLEARHPTSRQLPLTDRRGHDLAVELRGSASLSAHPPAAQAQHALRMPSKPISIQPRCSGFRPASVRLFDRPLHRRLGVERVKAGESVVEVAASLGRTEQWLHKWLRRYEAEGAPGLADRSRAPKHTLAGVPPEVVAEVLATRSFLESSEHQGIGAEAIRYELEMRGVRPLLSITTIERILRRAGRTARPKRSRTSERHRPRPLVHGPGVLHQADWVGPRYLARRLSFYSLHVVDVGGGGAAAGQFGDRRMDHTAAFVAEGTLAVTRHPPGHPGRQRVRPGPCPVHQPVQPVREDLPAVRGGGRAWSHPPGSSAG